MVWYYIFKNTNDYKKIMECCKYCLEHDNGLLNFLVTSPCLCKNNVHIPCLGKWFWKSGTSHCPECKYDLVKDNAMIKFYYFFTMGCFGFLDFCTSVTHILFHELNH